MENKIQNHQVLSLRSKTLKQYTIVNRHSGIVTTINACTQLRALAMARKYFASNFVSLIH